MLYAVSRKKVRAGQTGPQQGGNAPLREELRRIDRHVIAQNAEVDVVANG